MIDKNGRFFKGRYSVNLCVLLFAIVLGNSAFGQTVRSALNPEGSKACTIREDFESLWGRDAGVLLHFRLERLTSTVIAGSHIIVDSTGLKVYGNDHPSYLLNHGYASGSGLGFPSKYP